MAAAARDVGGLEEGVRIRRLLLASEGRAYGRAVIERAVALALPLGAEVSVLSIARIWGSSFGFPNPWLMPTRRELEEQRGFVAEAVRALHARGLRAAGQVAATRNAALRIAREADHGRHDAIVMAADPPRAWLMAEFTWSQEPYRVRRRARVPMHLVVAG